LCAFFYQHYQHYPYNNYNIDLYLNIIIQL